MSVVSEYANRYMQNTDQIKTQNISGIPLGVWVKRVLLGVTGIAVLLGLYFLSRANYLFFHSLAEGFSIVIAFAIFAIAWNSRRFMDNNYLLFLGIAYLFVGSMDFVHTLAYRGMIS